MSATKNKPATKKNKKSVIKKDAIAKKVLTKRVAIRKASPKKIAKPIKKRAVASSLKKTVSEKRTVLKQEFGKKTVPQAKATKAVEKKIVAKKAAKGAVTAGTPAVATNPIKKVAVMTPPTSSYEEINSIDAESVALQTKHKRKSRNENAFNPQAIESKWQTKWEGDKLYRTVIDTHKPKYYGLTMLPYTSGDLHFGHWFPMAPSDARARYMRMNGYNVLFPIGFDAFGLPAENAAIKRGIHPKEWTYKNIENMRRQLKSMGTMFDWEREAITADPEYYKWTEWFFIQLYKAGLAYRKMSAVDWCPNCNTTLAREQVWGDDRHCERCGTPVIKKDLDQWFFKATNYADELLKFDGLDWPQSVKTLQTNWIDRSEGAEVFFHLDREPLVGKSGNMEHGPGSELQDLITVFTTRPDTLWGATFIVLSPEHPLVNKITTPDYNFTVTEYKVQAARQTEIQRSAIDKEKTGVFTGTYAINPVNQERIPIWIADYVMMSYGTGAIMAVPAHDERDFAFAKKYALPIVPVIQPEGSSDVAGAMLEAAYIGTGVMVNSGEFFNGTPVSTAKGRRNPSINAVIEWLERQDFGKEAINYRYRDWLISRQRYWGAPIPMVYCEQHHWNPVPENQLPVLLPDDVEWLPTGESPLKLHPTWKNTTCPVCSGPATRETDTMDTFMCSSWYHLRYLSPKYNQGPFDPTEYDYWMPVDTYTGGIEHATMHLLYTRFFHKALRDGGIVKGDEPMIQLRNQGIILGEDNEKMSKSRGNVAAPDNLVIQYGADVLRTYLMFAYRWQEGGPWNSQGIDGTARWLRRVWALFTDADSKRPLDSFETLKVLRRKVHQTLRRINHDFEHFEFNTIISSMMELMNEMYKARESGAAGTEEWKEAQKIYLKMLAPVAPHIAEELWTNYLGMPYSIHLQSWPQLDEASIMEDEVELPIQINGKVRDRIKVSIDATEEEIKSAVLASDIVQKSLEGRLPRNVIVVKRKMVSVVV